MGLLAGTAACALLVIFGFMHVEHAILGPVEVNRTFITLFLALRADILAGATGIFLGFVAFHGAFGLVGLMSVCVLVFLLLAGLDRGLLDRGQMQAMAFGVWLLVTVCWIGVFLLLGGRDGDLLEGLDECRGGNLPLYLALGGVFLLQFLLGGRDPAGRSRPYIYIIYRGRIRG